MHRTWNLFMKMYINVMLTLLFHCSDPSSKALWESMLNMKHKEAVMEVRRHLVEAASKENLPIKMSLGNMHNQFTLRLF